MPLKINPVAIHGPWTQGWALDLHTLSSLFVGDDAFGHPQFENKKSLMALTLTKTRSHR